MPIIHGYDESIRPTQGFYKWGQSGKKYYYMTKNEDSRKKAYDKSIKQMHAILYSQSKNK